MSENKVVSLQSGLTARFIKILGVV